MSTDTRPSLGRHIDRVSVDISADCRSPYRPRVSTDTRSTDALSTHDPSSPEAALLLVSTKNHDLWLSPTTFRFWMACKHNRLRPEPIRLVRLDSEHAQSDGKSVNRGLPVLDPARGRDSWCWPKGARPLGTRMAKIDSEINARFLANECGDLCFHYIDLV